MTNKQRNAFLSMHGQRRRRNQTYPRPSLVSAEVEESGGAFSLVLVWDTPDGTAVNPPSWVVHMVDLTNGREHYQAYAGTLRTATLSLGLLGAAESDQVSVRIIPATVAETYALMSGLRSLWKMDAASGDQPDSSGNANTLTDTNGTLTTAGKIGNAAEFVPAENNYLSQPSNAFNSPTGSMTVLGWFKPDVASGNMCIVDKWDSDIQQQQYHFYYNLAGYSKKVTFLTSSTGANEHILASAAQYEPGSWLFGACVYDDDAGIMRLHVNDAAPVTLAQAAGIFQGSADLTVGTSWQKQSIGTWDGLIDQVAIYNRALTVGEVARHYNTGLGLDFAAGAMGESDITDKGPNESQEMLFLVADGWAYNR